MNVDTSNTDTSQTVTIDTSGGDPAANNIQITDPRRCTRLGCTAFAAPGSDYCEKHQSGLLDLTGPNATPITNTNSGPSNRALRRQLDRIEGKLDSLLAALTEDDNE